MVLGMHRSGTSAVTTAIQALGVPLGDPNDQLPPANDNDAGFGESRLLSQNNEMLLDALGGRWDAPPDLPPGWERAPTFTELIPVERDLFRKVHTTRSWVWKDPRSCILAPFWFRVLGRDHRIVLVFRHPLAVAMSLNRRDGLSIRYGLALWERYTRASLSNASGRPVLVAHYSKLMSERSYAELFASDLATFVRRDVAFSPLDPIGAVDGVLRHDLRHNRFDDRPFDHEVEATQSQRDLYALLVSLTGVHEAMKVDRVPAESRETTRLIAAHRLCPLSECVHREPEPTIRLDQQVVGESASWQGRQVARSTGATRGER